MPLQINFLNWKKLPMQKPCVQKLYFMEPIYLSREMGFRYKICASCISILLLIYLLTGCGDPSIFVMKPWIRWWRLHYEIAATGWIVCNSERCYAMGIIKKWVTNTSGPSAVVSGFTEIIWKILVHKLWNEKDVDSTGLVWFILTPHLFRECSYFCRGYAKCA